MGAAERGGSGEEGAGEKHGAGGAPSVEKGSALQERRSGARRQCKKTEEVQGRDRAKEVPPISGPREEEVWARLTAEGTGRRALEPSCDCDRALRLLSLVGLAVGLRIRGLEGSVGLRRASGKEGAAVRERKRGARQTPSPGEAEGAGEGGGQSEGWCHSRGCSGPERTGVKVGPPGRVRVC